jgi:dynein heavy chain
MLLQDPTQDLLQIAEQRGMMESHFHALSLGQGQSPFATRMIKEGVREVTLIIVVVVVVF